MPASPRGENFVAFESVSSSSVLRLRLAAKFADLQSWNNHAADDAVRIGSIERGIREDRPGCRTALPLAMFRKLRGQLADNRNRSLALLALWISRNPVPDRTSNEQFTVFVVLPIIPRSSPRRAPVKAAAAINVEAGSGTASIMVSTSSREYAWVSAACLTLGRDASRTGFAPSKYPC